MRTLLRSIAVAIGLCLPLVVSARARAESAPIATTCRANVHPSTQPLPANAPALVLVNLSTGQAGELRVTHKGNEGNPPYAGSFVASRDPHVLGNMLLWPTEPLPTGRLTAEFGISCTAASLSDEVTAEVFVTDPAPLPTKIGKVSGESGRFRIEPDAALRAFLPVVMLDVRSRGQTIPVARYGELTYDHDEGAIQFLVDPFLQIGWCEPGEESWKTEVVEVAVHVAGAQEDPPPVTLDMEVHCDGRFAMPVRPDAGPDTETTVRDDAGGCALAPNAPASVWVTFAFGAGLVVIARRRRSSPSLRAHRRQR